MNWKWTTHIFIQMKERKISRELVEMVLNNPDEIVEGKQNRKIYQKTIGNKLMRVVTEGDSLVTVYFTNKIQKYWKGDVE